MQPCLPRGRTERARPLLGTRVAIRIDGFVQGQVHALIDLAFERVAEIHRLMSFHEAGSDLDRLHRQAARQPVRVNAQTWQVLSVAQKFSEASAGCFDITIGGALAASGALPAPSAPAPDMDADWHDIELLPEHHIRFRRPLWIDLGGIAKGYAVDCAIALLRDAGVERACVNAGGDLRLIGPDLEHLHLLSLATAAEIPVLRVRDVAVASSGGEGVHLHGITRSASDARARVTVVASDCMTADALTKIVLADRELAQRLLPLYCAVAYIHHPDTGWRMIGAPDIAAC